jgi:hypothetical protein
VGYHQLSRGSSTYLHTCVRLDMNDLKSTKSAEKKLGRFTITARPISCGKTSCENSKNGKGKRVEVSDEGIRAVSTPS